jgi:uncharacterized membrane protein
MPSLHPQVVHFAIALLFVGVAFRVVSLLTRDRIQFIGPAATTVLTLGTVAAVLAAMTGDAAHGPVEAMPGLRPIVTEHEQWGDWSRNIFLVVFLLELGTIVLRKSAAVRYAVIASAVVGVVGLIALYEAAEHGGEIVYGYAGGVGTRSGDPEDVSHLFRAGLYQQALADRKAGRSQEASRLMDQAAARFPDDIEIKLAQAESILLDRKYPGGAIDALQAIRPPADNRPLRVRHAMLTADALVAAGQRDGAIAVLQQILTEAPSAGVQQKLDEIKKGLAAQQ